MKKILLKISLLILLMVIGIFVFLTLKKEKSPSSGPASLKWQEVLPNAPWSGRDAHSTIVFKDKIWLFGGVEGGSTEHQFSKKSPAYGEVPHKSDIWVSQEGKNWQLVKEKAEWGERRSMSTVVFKDKIWLMGGWTADFGETKNDVWVSEDGINWDAVNLAPWSPREGHTVVVFKDKIWLMGGMADNKDYWLWKNDVWAATF